MPVSRKLLVLSSKNIPDAEMERYRDVLRAMRPLGVRFSEERIDGGPTNVNAWIETPEPKAPRAPRAPRQALGSSATETAGELVAERNERQAAVDAGTIGR